MPFREFLISAFCLRVLAMKLNHRHARAIFSLGLLLLQIGLGTGCAAAVPVVTDPATETHWPLEGGNVGRTRQAEAQIAPPLRVASEIPIAQSGEFVSPISYADGLVYADGEASLHVFPQASDEAAWEIQLPGYFLSPLISGNRVFVRAESGGEGFLFALDARNGAKLWQFRFPQVGSEHQNIGGHVTSPVLAGGKLLVASARVFYALDPETGQIDWELPLAEPVASSAAAGEGLAYISDFTHTYAVDIATGAEQWRFSGQDATLFFAPVVREGRVLIGLGSELVALDAATGDVLWRTGMGTAPVVPGGATSDVAFGKSTHELTAYDMQDGTPLWRYSALNFVSLPCISGDYLYTIIRLGHASQVIALTLHSGEEVWRSDPMALARSAPVVANGQVYVRSESGTIVAFSSSPTPRTG